MGGAVAGPPGAAVGAAVGVGVGIAIWFVLDPPDDECEEDDCEEEIEGCSEMCADAASNPNLPHVYGGSMEQCMKNCLPERCQGEPWWKGYK